MHTAPFCSPNPTPQQDKAFHPFDSFPSARPCSLCDAHLQPVLYRRVQLLRRPDAPLHAALLQRQEAQLMQLLQRLRSAPMRAVATDKSREQ